MNFFSLLFKNMLSFLFSRSSHTLVLGNVKLLVKPRSLDIFVVAETFLDKTYEPIFPIGRKVNTIVDLGAHIGDSSIWLANRFQPRKLLAVEMDTDTFNILKKNISLNNLDKEIIPLNKAVYSKDSSEVSYRKSSALSIANFLSERFGNKKVKTISLGRIINLLKGSTIDYLKIDIEGSEKFLFTKENKILFKDKVRFITVECHSVIGMNAVLVEDYLHNLGFEVSYKKITFLNPHNKLIHAYNRAFPI